MKTKNKITTLSNKSELLFVNNFSKLEKSFISIQALNFQTFTSLVIMKSNLYSFGCLVDQKYLIVSFKFTDSLKFIGTNTNNNYCQLQKVEKLSGSLQTLLAISSNSFYF